MSMSHAKRNAIEIPPGMFIFSKPVNDPADLYDWRRHFIARGIASEIVPAPDGTFVLCREGDEANHDTAARQSHKSVGPKQNIVRRLPYDRTGS